ncbi:MAG: M23 family metallopeptidase [Myxococcales bacterium]|nr:M23 family metallopeptidase [Myxococcales bacterium]
MANKPDLLDYFGLRPFGAALRQTKIAVLGAADVPGSKAGVSSLALLSPKLAIPLWRGRAPVPRKVILTNLFNHTQTPESEGWSTKRTQVRDFRGRKQTYDSHNGTDLCIPVGTTVTAPAAGQVGRIFREFNRGGLKIAIDHGGGLMTVCVHLAKALVSEGDLVQAGQAIAISGYSGLDGLSTFPWGIPHVHFNTWLGGEPVDPFAIGAEPSLWHGAWPAPFSESQGEQRDATGSVVTSDYDAAAVDRLIASCITPEVRDRLSAITPLWRRAAHAICERNYYPTRFPGAKAAVYAKDHVRQERLHMPFTRKDFDGVVFRDEL